MSEGREGVSTIGITMGDPGGIGPEIIVKAVAQGKFPENIKTLIIGDRAHIERVAVSLGIDPAALGEIDDLGNLPPDVEVGVDSAVNGKAAAEYIIRSVELWRHGRIDAVATAPISKRALSFAGYDFQGHTEFLAALTETDEFAMAFFGEGLRVVLLSTHLPLREAIERVRYRELVDLIAFSDRQLGKLLGRKARIAVAGLNPHASEDGLFGSEEANEIIPAIDQCRLERDIDVSGPYSPDTIFLRCHKGEFDAVIALYHDQATIPVKSLAFNSSVNVTLGLPFIRTSVDHGTAFDIAGKGIADAASMSAAIELAAELSHIK